MLLAWVQWWQAVVFGIGRSLDFLSRDVWQCHGYIVPQWQETKDPLPARLSGPNLGLAGPVPIVPGRRVPSNSTSPKAIPGLSRLSNPGIHCVPVRIQPVVLQDYSNHDAVLNATILVYYLPVLNHLVGQAIPGNVQRHERSFLSTRLDTVYLTLKNIILLFDRVPIEG